MVRESIRQAIEGKGMSQSRFARQLGMEASNFNAWLNGQRPLPYGTFIRTMNMLGLSVLHTCRVKNCRRYFFSRCAKQG